MTVAELKKRKSDGMVNVSLDADAVKLLDEKINGLTDTLGFRPTRSQGLRHFLKQNTQEKEPRQ